MDPSAKENAPRHGLASAPTPERVPPTYSRKDKSLGLLCENFVNVYGQQPGREVCLDAAAQRLRVERRRIYDIVNVLESVGVVMRKGKNRYVWQGASEVASKIDDLRRKAAVDRFGGPEDFRRSVKKPRHVKDEVAILPRSSLPPTPQSYTPISSQEVADSQSDESQPSTQPSSSQVTDSGLAVDVKPASGSRKEKSLGVLSQRFVQLFLMADGAVVSLEQAALQLMGQSPSKSELPLVQGDGSRVLKTKVRRLYDIANILSSLNIIEKVHTMKRKPAFQWVGIQGATFSPARLSMKRIAGSSRSPPGNANKRRKFFSSPASGFCEDSAISSLSPGSANSKHLDTNRMRSLRMPRNPFDAETLGRLQHSMSSMPQKFAERWQEWVSKAQVLVAEGAMTADEAENGIAALLGPRTPNGDRAPILGVPSPKTASAFESRNCTSETESEHLGSQKVQDVKMQVVKVLQLDASPTTDVEDGGRRGRGRDASLNAAVSKDVDVPMENAPMTTMEENTEWMNQEFIDVYMKKAREAGPAYAEKAEEWLRQLRQWQQTWEAPYRASMQADHAVQPQNGV